MKNYNIIKSIYIYIILGILLILLVFTITILVYCILKKKKRSKLKNLSKSLLIESNIEDEDVIDRETFI